MVRKVRYDSAFTFIYSKRSGTPAAIMEDQVPPEVVKDRFDRLLQLVQEISRQMSSRFTGTVQEVLTEGDQRAGSGSCDRADEQQSSGAFSGRRIHDRLLPEGAA